MAVLCLIGACIVYARYSICTAWSLEPLSRVHPKADSIEYREKRLLVRKYAFARNRALNRRKLSNLDSKTEVPLLPPLCLR